MASKTSIEVRTRPNILITGVPCAGKTTIAKKLAEQTQLTYLDINDAIVKFKLHSGFDDEYKSFILDEDKLLDYLEEYFDENQVEGGLIIDYHSCEFFPMRWFDYVIVLRCENAPLFDRLHARENYSEQKRTENLECEIMGVIAEEAHDAYPAEGVVHELQNNNDADIQSNINYIQNLIGNFKKAL